MKAILKATGETVEVNSSGTMSISCGAYRTNDGRMIPATALEFEKVIDWEQRRYEIAKAAMQGRLSNQYGDVLVGERDFEGVAVSSVGFADALISELKKDKA